MDWLCHEQAAAPSQNISYPNLCRIEPKLKLRICDNRNGSDGRCKTPGQSSDQGLKNTSRYTSDLAGKITKSAHAFVLPE
jgi:hypothetical protein